MASSSKNLEPFIGDEASKKRKRQLRCINRRCSYGDTLIDAIELVCSHYAIDYKPGKKVCIKCFEKCLKHYKYLEKRWNEGKCIMDASFPSFGDHIVIEDSSSEEEEGEDPKPSTSKVGLPPDQDVKNAISNAINSYFNENKNLIEHHLKLCEEFIDKEISERLVAADEIDEIISNLEDDMASLRNLVYGPYEPIITSLEPVDINELEENIKE